MEYREAVIKKVDEWVSQLNILSKITKFRPQAAYCAFTAGYRYKFNYTLEGLKEHLQPTEDVIPNKLIPALYDGRSCSDDERLLLSLPVKYGRLGMLDLTKIAP